MTDEQPALDRLACLAGRSWRVDELAGGLTNVNLRVRTTDDPTELGDPLDVVVRWTRGNAELLGIDREAEHDNAGAALPGGRRGEVLEYRPDLSIMVIGFVIGTAPDGRRLRRPGRAEALRRRRTPAPRRAPASPATSTCSLGRRATSRWCGRTGCPCPPGTPTTRPPGTTYAGRWRPRLGRRCPCNNDLLAANYIDDGEQVWLIDYEYSGNNDACFELGNTTTECNFTEDQIDAWCEAYFGDPTPADRARVRVQALCSQYGWSLWGFIQEAASAIDYDFHSCGLERYEKAAATFRGGGLPRLLEQVAAGG